MRKNLASSVKSYAKNLGIHFKRVILRQESAHAALGGAARDARKLGHTLTKRGKTRAYRGRAIARAKQGREAYNAKDYPKAEKLFRRALRADDHYGLAYLYLGNALYKQERLREAMMVWDMTIGADPGSDAAVKARRKLQRVHGRREAVLRELANRLQPENQAAEPVSDDE